MNIKYYVVWFYTNKTSPISKAVFLAILKAQINSHRLKWKSNGRNSQCCITFHYVELEMALL